MNEKIAIGMLIVLFLVITAYLVGKLHGKSTLAAPQDFLTIYNEIKELPARVLATIQGSINPQKGKLAELLTYAQIRYEYDVIIPLGRPVDFIGIKNGEKIDFIEVKSGEHRLLTEEEKEIEKLVRSGKINFRLVLVTDKEINENAWYCLWK